MGINKKFVAKNGVDNNSQRLTNVAYPLDPSDATNKTYVDNMAAGLDTKQSVKAATTSNITLSGSQTIDDVNVVGFDRVLVKNQTNASENGIYVVNQVSSWTRSSDTQSWEKLPGAFTFVEKGTVNADTGWVCISDPSGTVGVTPITWTQFAGTGTVTAGTGISVSGTQVSLSTLSDTGVGSLKKITRDGYGRVTGTADVTATDITNLTNLLSNAAGAALGTSGASGTSPAVSRADHVHPLPTSLQVNNGTAAAPSLSFSSDPDTGIYKPNNDTFAISTLGSERLRIDNSGNVSIGTNSPFAGSRAIYVQNSDAGATSNAMIRTSSNDGNLWIITGSTANGGGSTIYSDNTTGKLNIRTYAAIPITLGTANIERMRIDANGNVGIGRTPAYSLDVGNDIGQQIIRLNGAGSGNAAGSALYLKNGTSTHALGNYSAIAGGAYDSDLALWSGSGSTRFYTGSAERMRIDANGNVGIGTASPQGKLDISGGVFSIYLNGTGYKGQTSFFTNTSPSVDGGSSWIQKSSGSQTTQISLQGVDNGSGIIFQTGGANERMRIAGDGNVSISNSGAAPKRLTVDGSIGLPLGQSISFLSGVSSTYVADWAIRNIYDTVDRLQLQPSGASNGEICLYTGPAAETRTERMRIDANGNVGIGEQNPAGWNSKLVVRGASGFVQSTVISTGSTSSDIAANTVTSASGSYSASTQVYGDGFVQINMNGAAGKEKRLIFNSNNKPRWACGSNAITESGSTAGSNFFIVRFADNGDYLGTPLTIYRNSGDIFFEGHVTPWVDNTKNLGGGSSRWATIYAGTGTINTSDAREKTEVRSLTENEIQAAQALSKEIGAYKFLSSIAEKGDAAREHIGMTVQRAIEVMESFNLNPFNYGFICYDEWDQQTETIPAVEAVDEVLGEDGTVVKEAVEAKPEEIKIIREAGNRYSFRMDELSMFIARGVSAKLESIEARLAALEV